MVTDFSQALMGQVTAAVAAHFRAPRPPPRGEAWEIGWDGSHRRTGTGLGVTLRRVGDTDFVGAVIVPVAVADATRVEALGPPLAGLLLAAVRPWGGRVTLWGDSLHVVQLLARATTARDIFLYNCRELTHDVLSGWSYSPEWVPREENTVCDRLAV